MRQSSTRESGYVYVLTNKAMPGLVKIGMTRQSPRKRAAEISKGEGVPMPYRVHCFLETADPERVEAFAHQALAKHRLQSNREHFELHPDEAQRLVAQFAEECNAQLREGQASIGELFALSVEPSGDDEDLSNSHATTSSSANDQASRAPRESSTSDDSYTPRRSRWPMIATATLACEYCRHKYSVTVRHYELHVRCPECRFLELSPVDWKSQDDRWSAR